MSEPKLIDSRDLKLRQVPGEDAGTDAICRFAHTIDGYAVAGSKDEAERIARNPDPASLDQLRVGLFYRFRSLRHSMDEESEEDIMYFREMIRGIRALLTVVLAVLLVVGSTSATVAQETTEGAGAEQTHPSVDLPPELDRVLRDYEEAWHAKDPAALAALFTEDGFVLSSGRPPVRGREAIEERYRKSGGPLALRALAWSTEESLGYIVGAFAMTADQPDMGKFTLTLRRDDDGHWLIFSDMDNGNRR